MNMVMEGVTMMSKRRPPSFIEDTLQSFAASYDDEIRDKGMFAAQAPARKAKRA